MKLSRTRSLFRRIIKVLLYFLLIAIAGMLACNLWVVSSTRQQLVHEMPALPEMEVGLVLGTTPYAPGGRQNRYFVNRMKAAQQLYQAGKVRHFILSGDNRHPSYNEPVDMKRALMKLGIPEEALTLDYAGFRTLDSVVRCAKVFQQQRFLIVSQEFHNHRALFIANKYGYDTIAYNAPEVEDQSCKIIIREWLARCKAVIDLYILHTKPRFLGKKIDIRI